MYEQSVNIKNPVEINLLYVQSRDAILNGTHPCTIEEAVKASFNNIYYFLRIYPILNIYVYPIPYPK